MFEFKGTKEQLIAERRRNEQLAAALTKTAADMEYIAMMTDVELDNDEEDEADGDEQI